MKTSSVKFKRKYFYLKFFKPLMDYTLSAVLLFLSSPIFLLLYFLILIKLNKPVFYIQRRPGKNGKPFNLIKFRTLNDLKDENGNLLADEERITKFGLFIRSWSLDELPNFINVLKGEMSIVGPRPLPMEYLPLFNDYQKKRMEVKPGITGLVQISGRNLLSWEEKFKLDVYYVENLSFFLDLKILFLTIYKVFKREGIQEKGKATATEFKGNLNEK